MKLPPELVEVYYAFAPAIAQRLRELSAPRSVREYFYEFCYCICTPQSKALAAWRVVEELQARNFFERGFDPEPLLARREHYIRFHRTKARRLLRLREQFEQLWDCLQQQPTQQQMRSLLVEQVDGFGMKEASHALRNCGYFELAILDRHILRNLVRLGVIDTDEPPRNARQYLAIEHAFQNFAARCGLQVQELDLLLWAREKGMVLK